MSASCPDYVCPDCGWEAGGHHPNCPLALSNDGMWNEYEEWDVPDDGEWSEFEDDDDDLHVLII